MCQEVPGQKHSYTNIAYTVTSYDERSERTYKYSYDHYPACLCTVTVVHIYKRIPTVFTSRNARTVATVRPLLVLCIPYRDPGERLDSMGRMYTCK